MANKVYIGNLNNETNEEDLRELFQQCGNIVSIKILKDAYTGLSRGFGFIEMETTAEARKAISTLNGQELKGNIIKVDEARDNRRRGYRPNYRRY